MQLIALLVKNGKVYICRMREAALRKAPAKYKYQINAQFPKIAKDQSKGVSKEDKHCNMVAIVQYFQGIFNRREKNLDRRQGRERPTTSDQQFIDTTGESPKPPRKRLKKSMYVFLDSILHKLN